MLLRVPQIGRNARADFSEDYLESMGWSYVIFCLLSDLSWAPSVGSNLSADDRTELMDSALKGRARSHARKAAYPFERLCHVLI